MYHDPASRFEAGFIFLLAFTILSAFYTVVIWIKIWINRRFGHRKNLGITAIPRFLFGGRYKTRKAKVTFFITFSVHSIPLCFEIRDDLNNLSILFSPVQSVMGQIMGQGHIPTRLRAI
jgi:hypothetical protein